MVTGDFTIQVQRIVEFELWEINTDTQTSKYSLVTCEDKQQALDMAASFTEQNPNPAIFFVVIKATTKREQVQ